MVFERLLPESLLERKEWVAFLLAIIAATIGIIMARLLFPANSGIVSVIFASLLLLPSCATIFRGEERRERREKTWSLARLYRDNKQSIAIYLCMFFGIYLAYLLYSFSIGDSTIFREQLGLESIRGGATFSGQLLMILTNNWWVLLACFLIALVAGEGAIFFITWNASVWGTIFGHRAVEASAALGESSLWLLLVIFLITLPHVLLEGLAYILAMVAGGVLSDEVLERTSQVRQFVLYLIGAVLLYVLVYFVLRMVFWSGVLSILLAVGILYCMSFLFTAPRDKMVFTYNFYLFLIALGVFGVAAIVEVLVLSHAMPLRTIYFAIGS